MTSVLILYYSRTGATRLLAQAISRGVEAVSGVTANLRTVATVSPVISAIEPTIPADGAPFVTMEDLAACDALILGSPTRFGQMASPLKYFFDQTGELWRQGALCTKPAAVFTSSQSMHGGQESTLLSMMLPLLHHGMILVGIPFTQVEIQQTQTGGGPYGASHVESASSGVKLSDSERKCCWALGQRVAMLAQKLQ